VFKIPHHGSMTAFHAPLWEQFLVEHPYAALTPFRRGRTRLPTADAAVILCQNTDRVWITHPPDGNSPRTSRNSTVAKTLREANIRLTQRAFPFGQVRLRRRNLPAPHGDWEVSLIGTAAPVCS
jgi:hypothetical protein